MSIGEKRALKELNLSKQRANELRKYADKLGRRKGKKIYAVGKLIKDTEKGKFTINEAVYIAVHYSTFYVAPEFFIWRRA